MAKAGLVGPSEEVEPSCPILGGQNSRPGLMQAGDPERENIIGFVTKSQEVMLIDKGTDHA